MPIHSENRISIDHLILFYSTYKQYMFKNEPIGIVNFLFIIMKLRLIPIRWKNLFFHESFERARIYYLLFFHCA